MKAIHSKMNQIMTVLTRDYSPFLLILLILDTVFGCQKPPMASFCPEEGEDLVCYQVIIRRT